MSKERIEVKRTLVNELKNNIDEKVKVQGWIQNVRDKGNIVFVVVRDHTGVVQVVLERRNFPDACDLVTGLQRESAVSITGKIVENPNVRMGGLEILFDEISIENRSLSPLPIDLFGATKAELDIRTNWRSLDLRLPENYLIFKIQTIAEMAMREYWLSNGFVEIHSPKLMGSASESGSELFKLDYFDTYAYLAQSPQFYKQMAMAAGFDKVFEIGPVFRANPSFTSRHDTEFTSVDVEISWIDSHDDVMSFEENWLRFVFDTIREKCGREIAENFGAEVEVPEVPFPRITMEEALNKLTEMNYTLPKDSKGDLDSKGEKLISSFVREELNHDFVFITDYPVSVRPFYHMRYEDDKTITKSFDLLWKGLEITTGAQREHRYDILEEQAVEKGLQTGPIQFYLDFFKYGCPPHGGFGFGLTRMLMGLLNIQNVREVTFIYRSPNRLYP